MAGDELVELKFRLYDGSDIGPYKYAPATTIGALKEIVLSHWPQDKDNAPKTINDMKLINAGKILENNKTLAESRIPVGELPGGVITMHAVVRPLTSDKNNAASSFSKEEQMCMCHSVKYKMVWSKMKLVKFSRTQFSMEFVCSFEDLYSCCHKILWT